MAKIKIGLSNEDKERMANDIYDNVKGDIDEIEKEIDTRLNQQNQTISGLGQLRPTGVDTSTNILAKTSDNGIWIGSDTGYWYYWDASVSGYVSGGVYINGAYKTLNILIDLVGNINCDYNFIEEAPAHALLEVLEGDDSVYYVGQKVESINSNAGEDGHTSRNITYYFKDFGKIVIHQDDININDVTYTLQPDDIYTKDEVNSLIKNKKSIIYVKSLPTTDIDENVIYGLSVVGNCTLYQGSNALSVMPIIYDESEIDTSQDGCVYNITTDMPYMIMGGEYAPFSALGETGFVYGGSATSTETFTDESTYYVLIGEEQINFYIYKNAWYRLLNDTGDTPLKLQGQDQIIRRAESSYYIGSQFEYSFNSTQNSKFDYIDYSNPDIPELSQKESQNPKINVSIGKQGSFANNSIFVSVGDSNNGTSKIRITPIETNILSGKLKIDDKEVATKEYAESRINYSINNVNTNITKLDNDLTDLKEALYGYVLDTIPVEIESTIPSTTTISDTTYNLVDNVRGLVKSVNGNTVKDNDTLKSVEYEGLKITNLQGVSNTILPFNTTLRGVGTVKDKIVITENENGLYTATKVINMGVVDLGSLNYYIASAEYHIFGATLSDMKANSNWQLQDKLLSSMYEINNVAQAAMKNLTMRQLSSGQSEVIFKNEAYSTINDFKTAMQGVMLQYELATPTTEVLSTTLTESEVMPLLELGGSIEIINSNSEYVNGSTTMEMVYKLINTNATSEVLSNE